MTLERKYIIAILQTYSLLEWRNWQTRTVEGRVGKPVRVRLPPRVLLYMDREVETNTQSLHARVAELADAHG
jgi:hypothetical protein